MKESRFKGANDGDCIRLPEKSYQLDWMRYYLQCKAEQNGGSANDVKDRDVEECYVKTNEFALVKHFISLHVNTSSVFSRC